MTTTWGNFATTWGSPTVWGSAPPVITLTVDSAWPPRVLIEVTGLDIGDVVTISRLVAGESTVIRGGDGITMADTALVLTDAEEPFGVLIRYTVTVDGVLLSTSDPITVTLPGGKVALSDAITGLACEAVISAWPDKTTDRQSSRFPVGGRTVVVSSPRGGFEGPAEFVTDTESSRQQMNALLDGCTAGIILIRQPGGYDGVDGWYAVLSDVESRVAQNGLLPRRFWSLDLVESEGWAPSMLAQGWTYADVETVYEGLTYADLEGDFDTYLDIAVFDWGTA